MSRSAARVHAEAGSQPPAPDRHGSRARLTLEELIVGRRSVRRYEARPVPRELVERVLEAGRWAPSPHGRQPWRFAVLTREERKRGLADAMGDEWRRQLGFDGHDRVEIEARLRNSRARILGAQVLIIPCLFLGELDPYPDPDRRAAEATMAVQSLGCAVQNMLLTAYHLELDGGWMCAPLFCPTVVGAALGLDPALAPHALITLGYAAADPLRRPRRSLEQLVVLRD